MKRRTFCGVSLLAGGGLLMWQSAPAPAPSPPFDESFTEQPLTAHPEPAKTGVPSTVVVDRFSSEGRIVETGLEKGRLVLPDDPMLVARYDRSAPLAAEKGVTLLASHVTFHGKEGVFFRIGLLRPADVVRLYDDTGTEHQFRVVSLEKIVKKQLPYMSGVWTFDTSDRRLVLVTCGGRVSEGIYEQNVVVSCVKVS